MAKPAFLLEQGPALAAIGKTVLYDVFPALKGSEPMRMPGPEFSEVVPPRSDELIDEYVRSVRGSVSSYKNVVPFYMFPQWTFPIAGKTIENVPWPLTGVMNAGFSAKINGPIPRGEKLYLKSRLIDGDMNDKRVLLTTRLTTGTASDPELLVTELTTIVKLPKPKKGLRGQAEPEKMKRSNMPKPMKFIPEDAREIGQVKLPADAGFNYAMVSGDINPLHWLKPYAQAFGQKTPILHGFASGAIVLEVLNKNLFKGRSNLYTNVDIRFMKPLKLPGGFNVYIDGVGGVYAGHAPGGDALISGTYETKESN